MSTSPPFKDPEWAEVEKTLPPRGPFDLATRRAEFGMFFKNGFPEVDYPKSGRTVTEMSIPVTDGNISIRTYIPQPSATLGEDDSASYPILIQIHGGGWCNGNLDMEEISCNVACVQARVSVVNVGYRLAPEFPFPTGFNDCYDTIKWAISHAKQLKADPAKGLIVSGLSAGGNYAAALAIRARDDPDFPAKITGQILQVPSLCVSTVYPAKWKDELQSYYTAHDPQLAQDSMLKYFEYYKGPPTHVWVSPMLAESHKGLPPALFQLAGLDPVRDEGIVYEKILKADGVTTKLHLYDGLPHGFNLTHPEFKISEVWRQDYVNGIKYLLTLKQ